MWIIWLALGLFAIMAAIALLIVGVWLIVVVIASSVDGFRRGWKRGRAIYHVKKAASAVTT